MPLQPSGSRSVSTAAPGICSNRRCVPVRHGGEQCVFRFDAPYKGASVTQVEPGPAGVGREKKASRSGALKKSVRRIAYLE
jgi:hypothetical protein